MLCGRRGLPEKSGVQARFLLGPAGSGKTFRCLAEIRAELLRERGGELTPRPLVLLAPKQATFQLERQLLADPQLAGYTRLEIVSFERLAQFLIDEFSETPVQLLADEGRLMVLRALLARHHAELRVFRATARLPGFATQLSLLLREFQRHQLSPSLLARLAEDLGDALSDKLHDFALLLRAYEQWLREHQLRDGNEVLDVATTLLRGITDEARRSGGAAPVHLAGLWLDGFAEMTPQEIDLLAALVPFCEQATLAFCLEGRPIEEPGWLSTWSVVAQTFRQCQAKLAAVAGCAVVIEELPRVAERGRFAGRPVLGHLERGWAGGKVYPSAVAEPSRSAEHCSASDELDGSGRAMLGAPGDASTELALWRCANPEAEAVLAAREILGQVRGGGRWRDCAVLVRQLRGYDRVLRRVFTRYEIPFFLDQREPVAHHPMAELTRFALRVAAFGWRREDWFGALKTGLTCVGDQEIDWLENLALEHGWEGETWRQPLRIAGKDAVAARAEALRLRLVPAFERLATDIGANNGGSGGGAGGVSTGAGVSGKVLAEAVREFWRTLEVGPTLERWSVADVAHPKFQIDEAIHRTVWRQMTEWLENLDLAFVTEALPLRDWLPILESGLSGLTVGVIPPALDQVLVGTIDRSRNPELQLALVLGLNESIFPAPPAPGVLLTDDERLVLERREVYLGPSPKQRLGHERYFGYIACTRSSGRLVLTSAAADGEGKPLNPSPFLAHLGRMFPEIPVREATAVDWRDAEHACELLAPLLELDTAAGTAGVLAPSIGTGGETPPELAGEDACGTGEGLAALGTAGVHACEFGGRLAPRTDVRGADAARTGDRGEDAPELAGGDACGTRGAGETPAFLPWRVLAGLPVFAGFLERGRALRGVLAAAALPTELVEGLLGRVLETSVSKLEDFAACPFKFFVGRTLRGEERKEFEVDARLSGEFQHEVMSRFHKRVTARGQRWRDLDAGAAQALVREIGEELLPEFHEGVFQARARSEFAARALIEGLTRLAAALVEWMQQYEFDPAAVELGFGLKDSALPGWRMDLGDGHALVLRGRIDRVDLARDTGGAAEASPLAVIVDYKSSARNFDALLLEHGLDLQLPAYLNALRSAGDLGAALGVTQVRPAGLFYVAFRGSAGTGKTRAEVIKGVAEARRAVFRHLGRFDAGVVARLDNRAGQPPGDQFRFKFKKNGELDARGCDALAAEDFLGLLGRNAAQLQAHGQGIFAGEIGVRPFRARKQTACDFCAYRAICRFDPWTDAFRILRAGGGEAV